MSNHKDNAPSPGGVQRWGHYEFAKGLHPMVDGDWVRYGDHVEVVKRLTKVEEQLLSLLEAGSAAIGKQSGEAHDEACRRVANELARLRKALEVAVRRCDLEINPEYIAQEMREALRGAAGEE